MDADRWPAVAPRVPSAVDALLDGVDLEVVSLKEMRVKIALHLGLEADALEPYKAEVTEILQAALTRRDVAPTLAATLPAELPSSATSQMVYLCTISRVLPGTLDVSDLRDTRRPELMWLINRALPPHDNLIILPWYTPN